MHESNLYSVLTIYFGLAWIVVSGSSSVHLSQIKNLKKKSVKEAHYWKLNINDSSTMEY